MPKVSVVTTIYNGESHIDRCAATVLGQTFDDFEWIVVDDGSDDRTPELLTRLAGADPRVRVLSPGRLGFAGALNHGIAAAEGEFIARQDVDDLSAPTRLGAQTAFLEANPTVGLVGGWYVLTDENRGERYVRMPPVDHEPLVRAMVKYIPFAHTVVMFRKAAWRDAGGYPKASSAVDLRLWIKLVAAGWRVANLPEIVGEHFVYRESYWHQNFRYRERQRDLARLQRGAVRELKLPLWTLVYPLSRLSYACLPVSLKRFARRVMAGSRERDVAWR